MDENDSEFDDELHGPLPTIDLVLPRYFDQLAEENKGIKLRRIELLRTTLREYLESNIDDVLTSGEVTLLAAERQFNLEGAACRVLGVDVLLDALAGFIRAPHLAEDLLLRKAQLDVVEQLSRHICYRLLRGRDASCLQIHVEAALSQARFQLRVDRRRQSRARLEAQPEFHAALERTRSMIEAASLSKHLPPTGDSAAGRPAASQTTAPSTIPVRGSRQPSASAE